MNYFSKFKILNGGFTPTPKSLVSGFTLTELTVVITIATVITTALVFQQAKWNDNLAVSTQAYDLALMIRQAQIYSLGVKENVAGIGDKFSAGYGVYFDVNSQISYIFFADVNGDKIFNAGSDTIIETLELKRGVKISDVCGVTKCFFAGGGPLQKASVVFYRPETKANIMLTNFGGTEKDDPTLTIKLVSSKNKLYFVNVESSGQVSITQ